MMDYNLNGIEYKIIKLDARSQFHIIRRLAPVLAGLAPSSSEETTEMDTLQSLMSAISGLSDDDSDYCVFGLLKAVSRKESNGLGYSPIVKNNSLMYQDIDMKGMLTLAWQVFSFNMSDFLAELPSDLKEVAQSAKAQ
jgi:hypothetical protein